jgi:hypothetical protein
MQEVGPFDLISPSALEFDTFGQGYAAPSVIFVSEFTIALDDSELPFGGLDASVEM